MKNYLFALLMISPFLSNGQFVRGDKFIGGSFQINIESPAFKHELWSYILRRGFSINPRMGFLLNEKFAIGGQIGYSYSNLASYSNSTLDQKISYQNLAVGFLARRYFSITDKFIFAIHGQINVNGGTTTSIHNNSGTTKSENLQVGASVLPCFIYFPTPKWGFEASVGSINYYFNHTLSSNNSDHSFNLNVGSIGLGVHYYFRKKN